MISNDDWSKLLYSEIWKDTYLVAAQRTWDRGFEVAKKDFDPDVWASWIELVLRQLRGEGARRIASITGHTITLIQAIIDAAAAEGLGSRDVSKRLRESMPEMNRARADRIARTEVHSALNSGSMQATRDMTRELGLTGKKVWISTPDEKTRASHIGVEPVGIDEKFSVGGEDMDYPGDMTASPAQTVNCRCALATELEEPDWMRA